MNLFQGTLYDNLANAGADVYIGSIKSFNALKGYGFIECATVMSRYGQDAFLSKHDFELVGCPLVGSRVSFEVRLNEREQPQAACIHLTDVCLSRAKDLRNRSIRKQVEWYLSDANLSTDEFFYAEISSGEIEGWVNAQYLLKCTKIRNLGATAEGIFEALGDSHLEVKLFCNCDPCKQLSSHLYVRRRQPLPPFVGKEHRTTDGTVVDVTAIEAVDTYLTAGRLKDQKTVQETLGLKEIGDDRAIFREVVGDHLLGAVIAQGYERVVYGDHGPYIEFTENHINWDAWPHFHDKSAFGALRCYDEYYTPRSLLVYEERWNASKANPGGPKPNADGVLMLYAQTQTVDHKPYAPGRSWTPARMTGYADYRVNCFYVSANCELVGVEGLKSFFVADYYKDGAVDPVAQASFHGRTWHSQAAHQSNVCWQWQRGQCWKGDACKWLHSNE